MTIENSYESLTIGDVEMLYDLGVTLVFDADTKTFDVEEDHEQA